ncbi:AAA and adenylate/guanylate cyclase domain-containing protein [Candidatus Viridilinea mediisalina]|nr:AAA and adenylate/guanylate cyclase domain-containing protein [Candidatus Viridilinea mediisalina]
MQQDQARQLLAPYLPIWLRERIGTPELQPGLVCSCSATILHADLSGFSQLTAAFALMPDGAERLHELLNRCYSALVETIRAYDGDVASIAGDALTAWWPQQVDLECAQRCAAAMLAAMAALPVAQTPTGDVQLRLRIGVSTGLVDAILAGLPHHGLYFVLTGPAVLAATNAQQLREQDAVRVAPASNEAHPVQHCYPLPGQPLQWEHFLSPSFVERLRLGALIAEYRWTTPVFARFALPSNPEAFHNLVAQVQVVVLRWGGWLNEIEIGDKGSIFVLLFGAPIARGDEPSRAVGCCLELLDLGLILKAGITLGWLFVGAVGCEQRRVYTAQGDDMNLAAHLMSLAPVGEIMVSGRIRSLVQDRFAFSEPTHIAVKGHSEGVPVARVLMPAMRFGGMQDDLRWGNRNIALASTKHVVGREALRAGMAAAAASAAAGRRSLILLEGESGIGKSSLLSELLVHWMQSGRRGFSAECNSGSVSSPLAVWRSILLALCGIEERMAPHLQHHRFNAILEQLPKELQNGAALLKSLMGFDEQRHPLEAPQQWRTKDRLALIRLTAQLINQCVGKEPLLIVIDDVHWAHELSLELANELMRSGPSYLCLALSHRPLDSRLPQVLANLRAQRGCMWVTLGRLSSDESQALMCEQLGARLINAELARQVERHTEGQPLFIKEYLHELCRRKLITIEDGEARLRGPVAGIQVSSMAQGVIQARVDRLDAATRLTLKVAAVLGKSFQLRLLKAVHPARPTMNTLLQQLQQLAELQIIELELDGPEQVYRFKHGITHEVAYASLLFGQRRMLHAAVVQHYETFHATEIATGAAPLAVYDVLIAHLGPAEDWSAQAHYCHIAARLAARQFATALALHYIDQALAIIPAPTTRVKLLLLRIAVNERAGSYANLAEDLNQLNALSAVDDHQLYTSYRAYFRLRLLLASGHELRVAHIAPALRQQLQRRMRHCTTAEQAQLALLRLACNATYAAALVVIGVHKRAQRLLMHTLEQCHMAHGEALLLTPIAIAAYCYDQLGSIELAANCPDQALNYHSESLALGRQSDDWSAEARARVGRGWAFLAHNNLADAELEARASLATSSAIHDRSGQAAALRLLAAMSAAAGDLLTAERDAHYAVTISARAGARLLEAQIWADIADYFAAQGQNEAAVGAREEAARVRRG